MSTLSELLPAGGGGSTVDFVASGTLPNGKPVILKTNGQVEAIAESAVSDGTSSYGALTGHTDGDNATVYHEAENCVVQFYFNQTTGTSYAVAGAVTSSGLGSYGTPVATPVENFAPTAAIYDPSSEKVIVFKNSTFYLLSVSGTTITWESTGYSYDDTGTGTAGTGIGVSYDPTHAVIVIAFANAYDRISIRTFDTSSMTFGTRVQPNGTSDSGVYLSKVVYDKNTGKHICVFDNGGYAVQPRYSIISISGSSGSNVTFTSPAAMSLPTYAGFVAYAGLNIAQDPISNFIVVVWSGSNYYGNVRGYLFSTTGITSTTNTTVFASYAAQNFNVIHYPPSGRMFGMWKLDAGTEATKGSSFSNISANSTIAFTTEFNVGNGQKERNQVQNNNIGAYATNAQKIIIGLHNYQSSNKPTNIYIVTPQHTATNLASTNFVGTSTAAYTNGQTATIAVQGGLSTNQTGLTIGSTYYVQEDGTFATTADTISVNAGKALSATTLLLKDL